MEEKKDGNSSVGSTENSKVIVGEILEHLWTLNLEVGTFFLEMYLEWKVISCTIIIKSNVIYSCHNYSQTSYHKNLNLAGILHETPQNHRQKREMNEYTNFEKFMKMEWKDISLVQVQV